MDVRELVSDDNWTVGVVDGQPEVLVNTAGLMEMVKKSPLGEDRAKQALIENGMVPPDFFDAL